MYQLKHRVDMQNSAYGLKCSVWSRFLVWFGILETRFSIKYVKVFFCPGSTLWIFLFLGGFISRSSLASNNVTSRDWKNCPVYGFDIWGNDVEGVRDVSSWENCGYMCHLHPDCKFWSWLHDGAEPEV
jgi:hypothetical protein